jgi:hypothetical protein
VTPSSAFDLHSTAASLEERTRAFRPLEIDVPWRDEIIFPNYDGLSIFNMARTIGALLGLPGERTLDDAVWGGASPVDGVDRVVLFLTDGLGYKLLTRLLANDADLQADIAAITDGRGPVPLTSIWPSTTAVALPTLWNAAPPAEHGMLGTIMYVNAFAQYADMLKYTPFVGSPLPDTFDRWGLPGEAFVTVPSLPQRLAEIGVPTHLLLEYKLFNTGLSRILHRGVQQMHPHYGSIDMWLRLREVLAQTRGQRLYLNVYWPVIDGLSHIYGAENAYVANEVKHQMATLRSILSDPSVQDGRTLVLICADHGHNDTPDVIDLRADAAIAPVGRAMRGTFGGELRFSYLPLHADCRDGVVETVRDSYSDRLACLDPGELLQAGLFGPTDSPHPDFQHRTGDIILAPRLGTRLADSLRVRKDHVISIHGGTSAAEMLVPLMWSRI